MLPTVHVAIHLASSTKHPYLTEGPAAFCETSNPAQDVQELRNTIAWSHRIHERSLLHEHIQTAMGWTNSHLHQFEIAGERYSDPELLVDGFENEEPFIESTCIKLDKVVPKSGELLTFDWRRME